MVRNGAKRGFFMGESSVTHVQNLGESYIFSLNMLIWLIKSFGSFGLFEFLGCLSPIVASLSVT